MPTLTCKKGQHDFKPSAFPLPMRAKRILFEFSLSPECWYNVLGIDNEDINKGPGIYRYWDFKKNKNAFITGWKPKIDEPGVFRITPYENRDNAIVANEHLTRILKADELLQGYFERTTNGWQIWILDSDEQYQMWHQSALTADCIGKIDGWFGGNQTAPRTMRMYLNLYH